MALKAQSILAEGNALGTVSKGYLALKGHSKMHPLEGDVAFVAFRVAEMLPTKQLAINHVADVADF